MPGIGNMRVVRYPWELCKTLFSPVDDCQLLAYFQPPEQDVQMGRISRESPAPPVPLHLPEPAEEQKDVACTDPLGFEV